MRMGSVLVSFRDQFLVAFDNANILIELRQAEIEHPPDARTKTPSDSLTS
jgi:hypothetical protein